jgi:type I site-specific restriction endonuclease
MATGTGKTYTALQIIWRPWKAGLKKRILFLADRNVLVDQTIVNDFRPFGKVMAKLSTNAKTIERADGSEVPFTIALDKKRIAKKVEELLIQCDQHEAQLTTTQTESGPLLDALLHEALMPIV